MIKRDKSYPVQVREQMRGGDGAVTIEELLTPAEMYDKGRFFARLTFGPGASIGHHVHEGEMESFYIISGEAEYDDNGETVALLPGDCALTPSDEGHSIKSTGDVPLVLIAMILLR